MSGRGPEEAVLLEQHHLELADPRAIATKEILTEFLQKLGINGKLTKNLIGCNEGRQ